MKKGLTKFPLLTREFLLKKYVKEKISLVKLCKEVGCSAATIIKKVKEFNLPKRREGNGYTKKCEFCKKEFKTRLKNQIYCNKKCSIEGIHKQAIDRIPKSIGQDFLSGMRSQELAEKYNISETCVYHWLEKLQINTRRKFYGADHKAWEGHGEICGQFWSRVKKGATDRNLEFSITIEEAWELFLKQDKKCKLTGLPIFISVYNEDGKKVAFNTGKITASLDRKDSSIGYTTDNIQWVHKVVNLIKGPLLDIEFIKVCNLVAKTNPIDDKNITIQSNYFKSRKIK